MTRRREHWGSQLGFILASAGSAIGLGTLWMFPYITGKNGGGLFVTLFFLCTLFCGIPLWIAEVILGRHTQKSSVGAFAALAPHKDAWRLTGWMGAASSFLIMSYYSVVAGWGLNYILLSLNKFWDGKSSSQIAAVFDGLARSGDITLFWHFIFSAITGLVVYQGIRKGIEFWSRIMTMGLIALLLLFFLHSLTLDGFSQSVEFIFHPKTDAFTPSGALEALGLSLFTLSLAQGIMITYGSYMQRDASIPRTSGIVALMVILISILAAFTIFPIIFTYGHSPAEGPGLVFKTLPIVFATMPGSLIFATLFFTLFVFAGLTSSVALVEVVAANFIDLYGWSRHRAVVVTVTASAILGIPSALSISGGLFDNWEAMYGIDFFSTVANAVGSWLLPLGGLCTALFTGWVMDQKVLYEEFASGTRNPWLFTPWRFLIRWVVPLATILILFYKTGLLDIDAMLTKNG